MNIENYFESYPLSVNDVLSLISSIETQNKSLLPLINGIVLDYLETEASDHEAIWKALNDINGPLDGFVTSIEKLLVSSVINKVTRESILISINNGQRLSEENLLMLEQSINRTKNDAKASISAAIEKALLFIDVYYKREMQEVIPIYRYKPMLDDLRSALVAINNIN